ncbi:putative nucleotidase YqfW [Caldalkalibacillus thermarum]|uniref:5' nucleotidase, NT5C type n=1 Tax=Caldalkalibacillus thermarum TaxID=296745 RepID=UPI001662DD1E|nr:hypothetical protein [Caldalkalibacillus thermarum]GGK12326.1 putative nucleotidase YqfW [Caldalkalibacillus thermarum]
MAKQQHKLGIDIDGTVTDPATFVPFLNKAFNKNLTLDDITQYHLPPLLGVTDDEFWAWMQKHEGDIYAQAPPAEAAKAVLSELSGRHRLIYITARPPYLKDLTIQWFERHGLPYDHIELLGSHKKVKQAKQHGVELFFEDRLETANAMAEELDIPVILFNTPYNQGTAHRLIHRVRNWTEAKQKLTLLFGATD